MKYGMVSIQLILGSQHIFYDVLPKNSKGQGNKHEISHSIDLSGETSFNRLQLTVRGSDFGSWGMGTSGNLSLLPCN